MPELLAKEVKKWFFSVTKSLHKRHTGVGQNDWRLTTRGSRATCDVIFADVGTWLEKKQT